MTKRECIVAREALVSGHTSDGREIPTKPCRFYKTLITGTKVCVVEGIPTKLF